MTDVPPNSPAPYNPNNEPTAAQPYAGAPASQQEIPDHHRRGNPWGLVALIVGIVAIVGSAIPIVNNVSIVLGVIALVFGIIGLFVKNRRRGLAITGVVLGALSIIIGLATQAIYSAALDGVSKAISSASAESFDKEHTIKITVEGDSTDATISYTADGGSEQASGPALPFTKEFSVRGDSFGTVTATNGQTGNTVKCTVTVDGTEVTTNSSSGQFATASCNYSK